MGFKKHVRFGNYCPALLVLHLTHFWAKMQLQHYLGNEGENPYDLVKNLFSNPLYVAVYLVWIAALYFHLSHGFWSMFQSLGTTDNAWLPRLKMAAQIFSILISIGFATIPVYFFLGFGH